MVSDNATAFRAEVFKNMCFSYGVKHIFTSTYYPCPNIAERVHRNLRFALTAFTQENHATWDQFLGDLSFAFNTATHEGTGYTPCKLFFGRDIPHPLNNVWKVPISIADNTTSETKLANYWQSAVKNLSKAHKRYASAYNILHSKPKFNLGDMLKHGTAKLEPLWVGPFEIVQFLTPVTVVLKIGPNNEKICHVSHLKPYHGSKS
ncbi:hypothetical protein J437_LFUL017875 [Ladona fulva]|uniref:Integrase catalytic domain-containing protein n=1 Tax=Ladona fulva TaxID=123851 RepID=A0A8K0KMM8_LADFU|nr:hypothetical protein J437_LFUL017875 [Ladona fulva]